MIRESKKRTSLLPDHSSFLRYMPALRQPKSVCRNPLAGLLSQSGLVAGDKNLSTRGYQPRNHQIWNRCLISFLTLQGYSVRLLVIAIMSQISLFQGSVAATFLPPFDALIGRKVIIK